MKILIFGLALTGHTNEKHTQQLKQVRNFMTWSSATRWQGSLRPFLSLKTHYLSHNVFKDPFCHTDSTYFTASLMYVVSWCSLSPCKNFFHYISCWLPPPCGWKELQHNTHADVTSWGLVYNTVIISVCCLLTRLTSSPPQQYHQILVYTEIFCKENEFEETVSIHRGSPENFPAAATHSLPWAGGKNVSIHFCLHCMCNFTIVFFSCLRPLLTPQLLPFAQISQASGCFGFPPKLNAAKAWGVKWSEGGGGEKEDMWRKKGVEIL